MWSAWSPIASVLSVPSNVISEMIWCGFIVPCRVSRRWIVELGDRARALVADDRDAVDRRDVDGVAGRVLGDVARGGQVAVAALERGDRRLEARRGEELERREHAAVDLPGLDVAPAAAVDLDARVVERRAGRAPPCSSAGSGRSTGRRRPGRRTGSCPRRGRSRSTRAASSRRGSASGRSAGRRGRPGGSRRACAARRSSAVLPMRPRIVPATTREPFSSGLSRDVRAVEAEDAREVALEASRRRRCGRVRSNTCWAPPASAAFVRRGLANRRCLAALPVGWLAPSRAGRLLDAAGAALRPPALGRARGRGRGVRRGRGRRRVLVGQLELRLRSRAWRPCAPSGAG